jgi:hypothetical protein
MYKLTFVCVLFFSAIPLIFGQQNSYEKDVWARFGQELNAIYFDYIQDKLLVRKANKYGVWDDKGTVFLPILYDDILLYKDWVVAIKDGQYGVVNYDNQEIIPFEYDYIFPNIWGFEVRKQFKRGLLRHDGKIVVPVAYDKIFRQPRNAYIRVRNDGAWGAVDSNGREILPTKYEGFYGSDHFFITLSYQQNADPTLYGLCDSAGKEILPLRYKNISSYKDDKGQAIFVVKDSIGVGLYRIDKPIQYFDYESIRPIYNTPFMEAYKNKLMDIVNYNTGETQQTDVYERTIKPAPFSKKDTTIFVAMSKDRLYGLADKKGKILVPTRYKYILPSRAKNIVLVGIEGRKDTILINYRSQKEVLPKGYAFQYFCSQNIFVAQDSSQKYVLMNTNGQLVFPYTYDEIHGQLTSTIYFYRGEDYITKCEWHKLLKLPWQWRGYTEWVENSDRTTIELPEIYRPNSTTQRKIPLMTTLADGRKILTYSDGKKSEIYEAVQTGYPYELLVKTQTGWGRQNHDGMEMIPPIYDTLAANYFLPWAISSSQMSEIPDIWDYLDPPHFYIAKKKIDMV